MNSTPEKFKDKCRERLHAAISQKMAGEATEVKPDSRPAPVIDIMAALKASLTQAKKPPASEAGPASAVTSGRKKRAAGS